MTDINDVARIGFILDNYDDVDFLKDKEGKVIFNYNYNTKDGKPAPMLLYINKD